MDSFSKRIAAVAAVAALSAAALPAAHAATVETVATGLDNPRSVAVGPDGAVYVASTGRAGRDCRGKGENVTCFGKTGRIVRIDGEDRSVVANGFASYGSPGGAFAAGVHGVSVAPDGNVFAVTGSGTPGSNSALPEMVMRQAGRLLNVTDGDLTETARIHRTEWRQNSDGVEGDLNSNPYAVLALADRQIVVDAGANAVLEVRGRFVKLLSVIPGRRSRLQAVPSSITQGPDGAYYVGELAESAGKGNARVWRVPAEGGTPTVYRSGFTTITGVGFASDGSLYVTEFVRDFARGDFRGRVVRVSADGSTRTRFAGKQLLAPTGLAVDDATGAIYVSNFSVLPRRTPRNSEFMGAGGTLVKITP